MTSVENTRISQRIVVAIATADRREELSQALALLNRQMRLPDAVIICPASEEDYDVSHASDLRYPVTVVRGRRGSSSQRNAILDHVGDADLIVFFDDDYYPAADYLARAEELMRIHPDVVLTTSWPAFDGATGPGLSHSFAVQEIESFKDQVPGQFELVDTYGGYGCNMVARAEAVRRHRVRFDEQLPLYAWLEDIDFSRQLASYGRIVGCAQLRGVHRGVKKGRRSGVRFGYSQIANPIYLVRKGTVRPTYAARQMLRNVLKNGLRALRPEPWVDRRGRLTGNLLAGRDLILGSLHPQRALRHP